MPVYEYECGQCAHKFDQRRSFSEGSTASCPQCSSEAKRVFAPVPIVFKGSGFYVTDYRKEKAPVEEKAACPKTDCASAKSCCCDGSPCQN